MESYLITPQQHSLSTIQVEKEPVKEVSNLLPKKQYTAADLMGLSWALFERDL